MTGRDSDGGLGHALMQLAEHGKQIAELRDLVDGLAARLTELTAPGGDGLPYQPVPAPRWWLLDGDERRDAIGRLADWVQTVYQPSYGHLAARLAPCWPEHPLCLFMLDWLPNSTPRCTSSRVAPRRCSAGGPNGKLGCSPPPT